MPFSGIHHHSFSSVTDGSQRAGLCRGNFFISKFLAGAFRHLKRFWARLSVCVAERACRLFSVVAAWRPFNRAKPAAWDPPPGLLIRAYSERFRSVTTLSSFGATGAWFSHFGGCCVLAFMSR